MTDENKPAKAGFIKRVGRAVKSIAVDVKHRLEAAHLDLVAKYQGEGSEGAIDFPIDLGQDTIWATQQQIADLFEKDRTVISKRLKALFRDGELDEDSVCAKFAHTGPDGKTYQVTHYNLDVILAVGYKESGKKAAAFRTWATGVLTSYLRDGYALNGRKLEQDPSALRQLAQEVRAIRTSEKHLYEQVRETFKACSLDYDGSSDEARQFFATCQDKFHWAVAEQTSAQIVLQRADGTKPAMGMTNIGNKSPTLAEAKIGKNYLGGQELRSMEILGEQWLLYAEGMAQRGKAVSMSRLLKKLDDIILLNEYAAFPGYQAIGPLRKAADVHAKAQLDLFRQGMTSNTALQ
ncbi:MAG: RhuM family protein [Devosia sp.]